VQLDRLLKLELTEKYVLKSTDLMLKIKNFPHTLPTGDGFNPLPRLHPPRGLRPLDRRHPNYVDSKKILKLCTAFQPDFQVYVRAYSAKTNIAGKVVQPALI